MHVTAILAISACRQFCRGLMSNHQPASDPAADGDAGQPINSDRLGQMADGLIRYRYALAIWGLLLTVPAVPLSRQLQMDESIESFYAPDNPHLQNYLDSKRWFGGDEFVLVAYRDPDLLSKEGLERVETLAETLAEVPGVKAQSTQDLARTLAPRKATLPMRIFLRIPTTRDTLLSFSRNLLIGDDNETTAVMLRLQPRSGVKRPPQRDFRHHS